MDRIITFRLALLLLLFSWHARAADSVNSPVGRKLEAFRLPDIHGKPHSLSDHPNKLVVLAFLGTECPLARTYATRLRRLAEQYADRGVVVLGIDANQQDSLAEMAAFARATELNFPFLKDNNNQLADRLGAQRTPEVFLLDAVCVVRYWGRIDNQFGFLGGAGYARPASTEHYLANAIEDRLAGREVAQPSVPADGCHIGRVAKVAPRGDVTYSQQIARIFQNHCVGCHRPGEVAPFSMGSYDDVVGWAETIREVVNEGRMPPWFANSDHGQFSNDARLNDEEKQQINLWVANGCPQGESEELPQQRPLVNGWQIGTPDQVIMMSEQPFAVTSDGLPQYQYFNVDPQWTTDKWLQATETRPGNRGVVHHIRVYVVPQVQSDAFPQDGIGWYAPGFVPAICPPGTAIHVPAGSRIRFQVHYTPNGTNETDRSMIGLRFADLKSVKKIVRSGTADNRALRIPPGEANYVATSERTFTADMLLLSLLPHMHLRGKSFRFEATYPDGRHEVLLDVPHYDFNWQLRYILTEPKLMPRGTRLQCTARFDNSADNPSNPDPAKTVSFGEQSWDEMMEGLYTTIEAGPDFACAALVALTRSQQRDSQGPDKP